jgi:hypothetical protein
MGELSKDSEPSARVTAGEGGDGGSDQPDRLKLVALPEPAAERADAPVPAVADRVDADRLALERSLSGPPGSGPWVAGTPWRVPPAASVSAAAAAAAASAGATAYAPGAPQANAAADAIALAATPELVHALRAELAMRSHAEAGLRARAIDAETRLAARLLLSQRTIEALRLLGAELDQLGGLLADERARRRAAEQRVVELERQLAGDRGRSDDAAAEIASVRDSLQQLRVPAGAPVEGPAPEASGGTSPDDATPTAVTEVRADRLNEALTRLRAVTDPIDPLPVPAHARTSGGLPPVNAAVTSTVRQPTLAGPFRALCRQDPALAGQLALSLLPLQRIAYPQPISYDIVLGAGHGCVQVTSSEDRTEVARLATARPLGQVDFHLVGGPERFAKLLAAGRIRRRFGFWVLSRVRGHRDGLAALDALLTLPLDLPALVDGGMSTDPAILAQLQLWINRA